jgi:hypothetical protein
MHHRVSDPAKLYHVAVMPCYDKKLEAAREELTLPETKVRTDGSYARVVYESSHGNCTVAFCQLRMLAKFGSGNCVKPDGAGHWILHCNCTATDVLPGHLWNVACML